MSDNAAGKLYALVANEEDARLCKGLPEAACREVPGNFLRTLISLVLTKVADLLASPKVVLPWLLQSVGAPAALIGWLVPIRESGSMVPQLAIGAWVRRHPRRAGFWVLGSVGQSACIAAMALVAWFLPGLAAGLALLALLVVFSLFRGLCSVAMKDVQGKCIPKGRRGRLTGLAGTLSGLLVAALGLALFGGTSPASAGFFAAMLGIAALLWLSAAAVFHQVQEYPGETGGGRSIFTEMRGSLMRFSGDAQLRHFVLTRALLMCSALAAPFLVVLVQQQSGDLRLLGAFLLASSLASTVSASVWGWMADESSRRVMLRGGSISALVCLVAVLGHALLRETDLLAPLLVAAYFALSIAHAGVRIGRKTYLVDMAEGNRRTEYVAVSNTIIGVLLLLMGAFTGLLATVSIPVTLLTLALMGMAGAASAARLREL